MRDCPEVHLDRIDVDVDVDVDVDYDLRAWAEKFGVDKERAKEAVRVVGNQAAAVERYLNRKFQANLGALPSDNGAAGDLRQAVHQSDAPNRGRMDKKVIQSLLVVNSGDEEENVRANIVEALRLILKGIETNEFRQTHALRSVATSIGFLASRCYREAARAAEQAITGVSLSGVESKATPGDLLGGLTALDSLSEQLDDSGR